jgi:hypothetical protein
MKFFAFVMIFAVTTLSAAPSFTLHNDSKKTVIMSDLRGHLVYVAPGKQSSIDFTKSTPIKLWPIARTNKCALFVQGNGKNTFNQQFVLTKRQWEAGMNTVSCKFSDVERRSKGVTDYFKVVEDMPEWLY